MKLALKKAHPAPNANNEPVGRNLRQREETREPGRRRHRRSKLTHEMERALGDFFNQYKTANIEMGRVFLEEEIGVTVCPQTVRRTLQRLNITPQKVSSFC